MDPKQVVEEWNDGLLTSQEAVARIFCQCELPESPTIRSALVAEMQGRISPDEAMRMVAEALS